MHTFRRQFGEGVPGNRNAPPSVTVAVDEIHVVAVTGILNQYGPLKLEERAAKSHRR